MLVLVDKPKGMTSHDVVDEIRRITNERKVGHAGTLDPNATGLLIVGVGKGSTRRLGDIARNTSKVYEAEIVLGEERDTDDAEGKILNPKSEILSKAQFPKSKIKAKTRIAEVLKMFVGEIEQVPPAYSAIKVKGRKAYELARKGKKVSLGPRKVTIYEIGLLDYNYPVLRINVEVSSGTYIRALARDIGRELGVGAYLRNLRRTAIGEYLVDEACRMEGISREALEKCRIIEEK